MTPGKTAQKRSQYRQSKQIWLCHLFFSIWHQNGWLLSVCLLHFHLVWAFWRKRKIWELKLNKQANFRTWRSFRCGNVVRRFIGPFGSIHVCAQHMEINNPTKCNCFTNIARTVSVELSMLLKCSHKPNITISSRSVLTRLSSVATRHLFTYAYHQGRPNGPFFSRGY